jgi:hypothetical protein
MRSLALQQLQQLGVFIDTLVRAAADILQQHHQRWRDPGLEEVEHLFPLHDETGLPASGIALLR